MINSHKIDSAIKIKKYQSDTFELAHISPKINTPPKSLLILGTEMASRWKNGRGTVFRWKCGYFSVSGRGDKLRLYDR